MPLSMLIWAIHNLVKMILKVLVILFCISCRVACRGGIASLHKLPSIRKNQKSLKNLESIPKS